MTNIGIIHEGQIIIVKTGATGRRVTVASEVRPQTLADADTFLAVHSLRRTVAWDLGPAGAVQAPAELVDNVFNGTVAARLWAAVGTTHDEWIILPAREVRDGDLISDMEISQPYVVAGSRFETDTMRVHMVRDGGVWAERHTTDFPAGQLVQVARKR